jgi:DNA-binding LacI/PurR family transcriptional regulator
MDEAPVSLRDVARASGVSVSTASRALSAGGRVAEATRLRVQAAAERMGYAPDWIQARISGRRRSASPPRAAAVALIRRIDPGRPPGLQERRARERYAPHLRRLGLHLEVVITGHGRLEPADEERLRARRLAGIIVQANLPFDLGGPWPRTPVVTVQAPNVHPAEVEIASDRIGILHDACGKVRRAGFRRPCLLMHASTFRGDVPQDVGLSLAIDGMRRRWAEAGDRFEVLPLPDGGWPAFDPASLPHGCDVLLAGVAGAFPRLVERGIARLPFIALNAGLPETGGPSVAEYRQADPAGIACQMIDALHRYPRLAPVMRPLRILLPFAFHPGDTFAYDG